MQVKLRIPATPPWWASAGFLRLWGGQFLSLLADWSLRAMLLIWVYSLTHSGGAVSLVGLAEAIPLLLVAPVAGAYVDRWHRARTMAGVVLARAVLVLPLLAVSSHAQLPLLVAVTLLVNVASQFFLPAAAAATPVVVGPERLAQANSLLSYVNSSVAISGPAAGALLFAWLGPHLTVVVLALLYLGAAPILAGIPAPYSSDMDVAASGLLGEIAAGIGHVWRTRIVRNLNFLAFVYCLGAGSLSVLDVLFISRALHLHANLVSTLYAANGAGALVGSTVMTLCVRWVDGRQHILLSWSVVANAAAVLFYAIAPTLLTALLATALAGVAFTIGLTCYLTLLQRHTHDALMGRVMSVSNMVVAAGLIGSLSCGGLLADAFGVRQIAAGCGLLILVCGLLCFALIRVPAIPTQALAQSGIEPAPEMAIS